MIFEDPEQALKWAYSTTERPIIKMSSVNKMRGAENTRPGDALTPYDFIAEAAMIKSLCARVLPGLHMAYVKVRYGRDADGLDPLRRYLAATFETGIYSNRCIDLIIRDYCGDKITLREMKRVGKCGLLKVMALRTRSYDNLDAIHKRTIETLWEEMGAVRKFRAAFNRPECG
jgi:hypothetical protein